MKQHSPLVGLLHRLLSCSMNAKNPMPVEGSKGLSKYKPNPRDSVPRTPFGQWIFLGYYLLTLNPFVVSEPFQSLRSFSPSDRFIPEKVTTQQLHDDRVDLAFRRRFRRVSDCLNRQRGKKQSKLAEADYLAFNAGGVRAWLIISADAAK